MFERNVYTDPIGWAQTLVATEGRYTAVSALSALVGAVLVIMAGYEEGSLAVTLRNGLLLFVSAVEMPLYYLRALRSLVVERQRLTGSWGREA